MLKPEDLDRVRLSAKPLGQRLVANLMLSWDYRVPKRTEIILEGTQHIPETGGAFLAMNHTDRYNYWPLQYRMYRLGLPFTASWVKGKYFESRALARFLQATNNIPLPSVDTSSQVTFSKRWGVHQPKTNIDSCVTRPKGDRPVMARPKRRCWRTRWDARIHPN